MKLLLCAGVVVLYVIQHCSVAEKFIKFFPEPPVIGEVGKDLTVKCLAPCDSVCHVSWRKDGNTSFNSNNGTLHFKSLTKTHEGNYTCTATSGTREMNSSLSLHVYYPTTFTKVSLYKHSAPTVHEGENVTMACVTSGDPPPVVKWHKHGINLKTEDLNKTYGHQHNTDRNYTSWYNITNVTCIDEGTYICQAGNSVNGIQPVEGILRLSVKCSPTLFNSSLLGRNYSSQIGGNVTINFIVLSNPKSTLARWIYQNDSGSTDILSNDVDFNKNMTVSENVHNITLSHYDVRETSTGLYTVFIVNGLKNLSITYNIWVYDDTDHDCRPNIQNGSHGYNITIINDEINFKDLAPYIFGISLTGAILIVVFALAFKGSLNVCVEGSAALQACNFMPHGALKLWMSVPSNENIYEDLNIFHFHNHDSYMGGSSFTLETLKSSHSFGKINHNNDAGCPKDYRDSATI